MSRPALPLLLALAVIAGDTPALAAQDIRQQERKLDSMLAIVGRATAALRAHDDSVALAARRLDTVTVGPVTVLTEPSLVSFSRDAARAALDSVRSQLGGVASRMTSYTFVIKRYRPGQDDARVTELLDMSVLSPTGHVLMNWNDYHDVQRIAGTVRQHILNDVFSRAALEFYTWMGRGTPVDTVTTEEWMQYRLLLVSSPTVVGKRCYDGDLRSCALALQTTPPPDPVMDWFDPTTRRLVVDHGRVLARRISGQATNLCLRGSDSACISVLRRFPPADLPEPLPAGGRAGIAQLATQIGGGPTALERMLARDAGSPAARLTAAAQVPMDTLLSRWQQRVRHARAPSRDFSFGIGSLSVLWTLALAAVATRSSRWR